MNIRLIHRDLQVVTSHDVLPVGACVLLPAGLWLRVVGSKVERVGGAFCCDVEVDDPASEYHRRQFTVAANAIRPRY